MLAQTVPEHRKEFPMLSRKYYYQYVANQFYKLYGLDAMIFLPLLLF